MSKPDDEAEEEDNIVGTSKYPCMPSLVALQQMRNRLQLAYLGKKLMKWTAMATGRELRRLAEELNRVYYNFHDDVRNAYMLLARARYFYPNLNKMVLQHVDKEASVQVVTTTKAITGVRTLIFDVVDSRKDSYLHLGIEKGGQAIETAKEAWLALLKRLVYIQQLRTGFALVDAANKHATKRTNFLMKVVIQKTRNTIRYIQLELEERAREELHRIKLVKKRKKRERKKKAKTEHVCPICGQIVVGDEHRPTIAPEIIDEPVKEEPPKPAEEAKKIEEVKPIQEVTPAKEVAPIPPPPPPPPVYKAPSQLPSRVPSQVCQTGPAPVSKHIVDKNVISISDQLKFLERQVGELVSLSKVFIKKGVDQIDLDKFIDACSEVKSKIEYFLTAKEPLSETDARAVNRLDHLKVHLRKVIEISRDFRTESLLSPSVERFIHICEDIENKLNIQTSKIESERVAGVREKLDDLKGQIKDVVKITEDYKTEGLLEPSVESFIKSCEHVTSKIDSYAKEPDYTTANKLEHLKGHVTDLEKLTVNIKEEGVTSSSLENFLASCKDFKTKLEAYKNKSSKPPTEGEIHKLVSQIDDTIKLSKTAKEKGLVSESVEDFIKSCEIIKSHITSKQEEQPKGPPPVLNELKTNIEDVMDLISNLRIQGLITDSIEDFLKRCQNTQAKLELYEIYPPDESDTDDTTIYPECSASCICIKKPDDELCEKCQKMFKDDDYQSEGSGPPPCNTCGGLPPPEDSLLCITCSQPPTEPTTYPDYVEPEPSDLNIKCKVCKSKHSENEEDKCSQPSVRFEEATTPVDSTLGYFENKVRTITRVKRTLNPDGTVCEETETTTIRKARHDPNETRIKDEYEHEFKDPSQDDVKRVAICNNPYQNALGFNPFLRKAQSNLMTKVSDAIEPSLRHCISLHTDLNKYEYELQSYWLSDIIPNTFENIVRNSKYIQ